MRLPVASDIVVTHWGAVRITRGTAALMDWRFPGWRDRGDARARYGDDLLVRTAQSLGELCYFTGSELVEL